MNSIIEIRAKEKAIKVWEALSKDGTKDKSDLLDKEGFEFLAEEVCCCPLCTLFIADCSKCPIAVCLHNHSPYMQWKIAESVSEKERFAAMVLKQIKAWEV